MGLLFYDRFAILKIPHPNPRFFQKRGWGESSSSSSRMKSTKTRPCCMAPKAPWNKGRAVGRKQPFLPEEILSICQILTQQKEWRDLALLAVGIDTGFRASDLLALRYGDLDGTELVRKQQKTRKNVTARLSSYTHQVLLHWAVLRDLDNEDAIFCPVVGRKRGAISRGQLAARIKHWAQAIGLNPKHYSTHSLRRSKGAALYAHCGDVEIVRLVLGQSDTRSTSAYLGIDEQKALAVAQQVQLLPEEFLI